mgnify:CR=1 FL=1
MIIPNPKSYTHEEWAEIVDVQGGFWHAMDDMMGVHLVEAAEMILDQKDQKLLIDSIDDTMTKMVVLQNLLHTFQSQETPKSLDDMEEAFENINNLRAGTNAKDVDKVEAAYRDMMARSQEDKEDE